MVEKGYIKCLYIFIAIAFAVSILYISSSFESAFAQRQRSCGALYQDRTCTRRDFEDGALAHHSFQPLHHSSQHRLHRADD